MCVFFGKPVFNAVVWHDKLSCSRWSYVHRPDDYSEPLWTSFLLLVFCAIAIDAIVAYLVIDFSADGNSYHDDAITIIASGGNLYADHLDVRLPGTPMFQWIFPAMLRFIGLGDHITSSGKIFASLFYFISIVH